MRGHQENGEKHIPSFSLVLFKTAAGTGVLLLVAESAHAADCLPVCCVCVCAECAHCLAADCMQAET